MKAKAEVKRTLRLLMQEAQGVLYFEGEIGEWGWTPQAWGEKVAALKERGCTSLQLRINSPGGSVVDALAICDCIEELRKKMRVEAVVCGLCASAATLIACVCDAVFITPSSTWMVHEPTCHLSGNAAELSAQMKTFEDARARVYAIYAATTGKTPEQLQADHVSPVYYTAEEAVAYGFCRMAVVAEPEPKKEEGEGAAEPPGDGEDKKTEDSTSDTDSDEEDDDGGDEAGKPEAKGGLMSRMRAWLTGKPQQAVGGETPAANEADLRALRAELVGARANLAEALDVAEHTEAEFTARVNAAVAAKVAAMAVPVAALPVAADELPVPNMAEVVAARGLDAAFKLL